MFAGSGSPRRKETERQRSINIERWLKNKFREGFQGMKTSFEETDSEKTGFVSMQLPLLFNYLKCDSK